MGFFIVITGPTGVGKTALVRELVKEVSFPIEVINADMGQFYKPLFIGTAKPDVSQESVPHYLFDVMAEPVDYTVMAFRQEVACLMKGMWRRKVVPLIVGGSSFYVQSLFFPPRESEAVPLPDEYKELTSSELWDKLFAIDPERAEHIHRHDRYRIERALMVWYGCGKLPSAIEPLFKPIGRCAFYFVTRDREDLVKRINKRTKEMVSEGWLDEVRALDANWRSFLKRKKLIGYPEIIDFIESENKDIDALRGLISSKTRAYAKRQVTYWRMLQLKLKTNDPEGRYLKTIQEVNLTKSPLDLWVKQLSAELKGYHD